MSAIKPSNLLKSSLIVSFITLFSRILGLIRDMVLLNVFGASGLMDAFLVAFKIPNFLRRLFSEGAFAQGFMPVLMDYQNRSKQDLQIFISRMFASLSLLLGILTTLAVMFAPMIIRAFAIGFYDDVNKFSKTVDLFRLIFPYVMFITLTAFASSILQSFEQFILPAITPIFLNICFIIFAVFISQYFAEPIFSLGVAVCVAGLLQLTSLLIPLCQQNLLVFLKIDFNHDGVKRVLNLLLPAMLSVSVLQLNLLINTFFASFLPTGSVSWLYTAERISEFPLGLIGVAIGSVILPILSKKSDNINIQKTLDWACYLVLLLGLPACFALWKIADILMLALFWHGNFTKHDALMSGKALQAMSVGILAFMLIKVFAPVFFANANAKIAIFAGVWAVLANLVAVVGLLWLFERFDLVLHGALAWAISFSAWVNLIILLFYLHKKQSFCFGKLWQKRLLQFIIANGFMLVCLDKLIEFFPIHASQTERILTLFVICLLGGLGYFLGLWLTGFRFYQLKQP